MQVTTIVNQSDVPVRIAYNTFRLVSDAGRRYSALPPFRIDGAVTTRAGRAVYPPAGFGYAPYLSPYFSAPLSVSAFEPNMGYWNRYGSMWKQAELPTPDMLQKALPEGVFQPGGRVTEFLYFEGVGPDLDRVRFVATFPNANSVHAVHLVVAREPRRLDPNANAVPAVAGQGEVLAVVIEVGVPQERQLGLSTVLPASSDIDAKTRISGMNLWSAAPHTTTSRCAFSLCGSRQTGAPPSM